MKVLIPGDISGTAVGESPDCLLLSGTVVDDMSSGIRYVLGHTLQILYSGLPQQLHPYSDYTPWKYKKSVLTW